LTLRRVGWSDNLKYPDGPFEAVLRLTPSPLIDRAIPGASSPASKRYPKIDNVAHWPLSAFIMDLRFVAR
jgi:hypothetical protein